MSIQVDYRTNARRVESLYRRALQIEFFDVREVHDNQVTVKFKFYTQPSDVISVTRQTLRELLVRSDLLTARLAEEFVAHIKRDNYVERAQRP